MKFKLTKAEYEALSDNLKVLYIADGDGYKLPLTDYEDAGEMRRARDREKADAATAKTEAARLKAELDTLKLDPARKTGDIATLEKSWQEKLTASETANTAAIANLKTSLETTLVDNAAAQLAAGITAKPENASLLMPHIRSRFEVVYDGDTPTVKIKDATGRISAMNMAELQAEIVKTPLFSSIVVVNKASGAGGSGGGNNNGAAGGAGGGKKFADMTGPERTALYQSDRAEFDRLATENKTAAQVRKFGSPVIKIAV